MKPAQAPHYAAPDAGKQQALQVAAGRGGSGEGAAGTAGRSVCGARIVSRSILPKVEATVSSFEQEATGGKKRSWADSAIEEVEIQHRVKEEYIDTSFVSPTSNTVERLFNKVKLMNSDLRFSMTPEHLEQLLYLRMNSKFWNTELVMQILVQLKAQGAPADVVPDI